MKTDEPLDTVPVRLEAIEERLSLGAERMNRTEAALLENTSMTRDVHELLPAMRQMHEMFLTWQSGMNAIAKFGRGLGWVYLKIVTLLKVLAPLATASLALYASYKAWKGTP